MITLTGVVKILITALISLHCDSRHLQLLHRRGPLSLFLSISNVSLAVKAAPPGSCLRPHLLHRLHTQVFCSANKWSSGLNARITYGVTWKKMTGLIQVICMQRCCQHNIRRSLDEGMSESLLMSNERCVRQKITGSLTM